MKRIKTSLVGLFNSNTQSGGRRWEEKFCRARSELRNLQDKIKSRGNGPNGLQKIVRETVTLFVGHRWQDQLTTCSVLLKLAGSAFRHFGACAGWASGNDLGELPSDVCKPREAGVPVEEESGTRLQLGRTNEFGQKECIHVQGRVPIINSDFVRSM